MKGRNRPPANHPWRRPLHASAWRNGYNTEGPKAPTKCDVDDQAFYDAKPLPLKAEAEVAE